MRATQKLIIKLLEENPKGLTSREMGEELGITHHAVNANISLLRQLGVHVYISDWQMTGGRGKPVHSISKKPKKDKPEPKRKPDSWYRKRLYDKRRAYETARSRSRYRKTSPWDGLIYDSRNAA